MEKSNNVGFQRLLYVSFVFLLLCTAYNSVQNLVSGIYEMMGYSVLGKVCLFFFYGCYGIGSCVCSSIIERLGLRMSLIVAVVPYMLGFLSGPMMSACTYYDPAPGYCQSTAFITVFNLVAYGGIGFGASLLWNTNGAYINAIAAPSERGLYVGIFFTILQTSFIVGSILPTIIFQLFTVHFYFLLMLFLGVVAFAFFFGLSDVSVEKEKDTESNAVELLSNNESPLLYQDPEAQTVAKKPSGLVESIQSMIAMTKGEDVKPWLPFMILAGFTQAFNFGYLYVFVKDVVPPETPNEMIASQIAQMFIFFGLGETLFPMLVGKMADKMGTKPVGVAVLGLYAIFAVFSLIEVFAKSFPLVCFIGFLCGALDTSIQTFLISMISIDLKGKVEFFGFFRFINCIGTTIGFSTLILFGWLPMLMIVLLYSSYIVWVGLKSKDFLLAGY